MAAAACPTADILQGAIFHCRQSITFRGTETTTPDFKLNANSRFPEIMQFGAEVSCRFQFFAVWVVDVAESNVLIGPSVEGFVVLLGSTLPRHLLCYLYASCTCHKAQTDTSDNDQGRRGVGPHASNLLVPEPSRQDYLLWTERLCDFPNLFA